MKDVLRSGEVSVESLFASSTERVPMLDYRRELQSMMAARAKDGRSELADDVELDPRVATKAVVEVVQRSGDISKKKPNI